MGDRANICMVQHPAKDRTETIYFYTHWAGSELPLVLKNALMRANQGQSRWTDESYLARIIFCEMIKDDVLDQSGYGISTYLTDNEHDVLVVDSMEKTVGLASEKACRSGVPEVHKKWTFEEYIALNISPRGFDDEDNDDA